MFIIAAILNGVAFLVQGVATILMWIIIIQCVLSWLLSPFHPYVQMLSQASEPVLKPFRRLPLIIGTLDLTPLVAIVAINVLKDILLQLITMGINFFSA